MPLVEMRQPDWRQIHALGGCDGLRLDGLRFEHVPQLDALGFGKLRSLSLRNLHTKDLAILDKFPVLENLRIWQSSDVISLDGIWSLKRLKWLALFELGPLPSLHPLSTLGELRTLSISGGIWKDQKILGDFLPLAALTNLRQLIVTNVRGPVDLAPLLTFKRLEYLYLATARFPVPEIARMAAKYAFWYEQRPWLQPLQDDPKGCTRCGKPRTVLLLKRKKALWCEHCESTRLSRYFQSLKI